MIEEREELTGELIASGEVIASLIATKGAKGDKGDKGDTGNPGADGSDGADGISPIITTSKSDKTTTITIVDAEGTKTATIVDGEDGTDGQDGADGQDGQDGFSPVANVTKSGDTATISITDANGTTTASISDGADGADGADGNDGQDGFSPIANVSKSGKIATITITDSLGTTTAEIRDGEDGQGSGDMLKSIYDTNNNGIVDNAELVNSHTVLSDVPADAVFTDTTYTAGTGIDITNGVISNTQTSAAWGNITGTLSDQTDLNSALGNKANTSDLATVATSGSYTDLSNKPTIPPEMVVLTYGTSTWSDFITAYNKNAVVYCKNSGRMAFMAYVTSPTLSSGSVEFQYYKSSASHSSSQQMDQVFVYKLSSSSGGTWTTETRDAASKIVAGTGLTSSYSGNTLTLKSNITVPTKTSDLTNDSGFITSESDPVFTASDAYGITSSDITAWNGKQDALVSGTNIKTINNTTILGSGNIDTTIPIQGTAPLNPQENDLWIDTSINQFNISYFLGTELYNNASGSNDEITLSDNIENYARIKVFYKADNNTGYSQEFMPSTTTYLNLTATDSFSSTYYEYLGAYTIGENKLTPNVSKCCYLMATSSTSKRQTNNTNYISIQKVIGYKY